VHDNPDHHALRAAMIPKHLPYKIPAGCNPRSFKLGGASFVFEQLRTDQQPAIDTFMALPMEQRTLGAFFKTVEWEKNGWAKYDYKPLFKAVLDAGLPIYAGDAPRDLIRKAAKEGAASIPSEEQKRLGLDVPLDPSLHDASLTEIEQSHCGAMPKSAFGGMAFAQRLRDATLADVALTALEKHGAVVVFAGNGHVRSDRGVPWYVRQRNQGVPVKATMLVEVENGKTDPEAYVPRDPDGKPAVDTIIFTPRAERDDPCKVFRRSAPKAAADAPKN
ncbi:MAG: ChaN family lipoprotein, partial [Hyphomicrobium sp.]